MITDIGEFLIEQARRDIEDLRRTKEFLYLQYLRSEGMSEEQRNFERLYVQECVLITKALEALETLEATRHVRS